MSCGLKKQNTNEGGVHLTERTCSPYNPIIKLIVDDCLGLPIYPVSSVDAVINEEGRTLRLILEDILNNLNQNTDNFDGLIDDINEAMEKLEEIENAYVSKTELQTAIATILENLNGLKAWLMLISKFDLDSSTEVVESLHPHILTYLSDLKSTIIQIMQYIGMGDDPSEEGIAALLANLKALVEEIAKCGNDTVYTEGVTWIVKYVTDLLEGQENLQEDLNKRAHLDPEVLNLKPSTIGEEHYEDYETLKISEYPPTTAKFITESTLSAVYGNLNKIEGLMYFAELPDKVILNKLELYPFTYGINTLSPVGNKLFYLGEDNNKHEVLVHGRPVYVGDGRFNEGDYLQLIMSVLYQESNAIVNIEGETVDLLIPYGRLCFQSSQTPSGWVQYGDYNFDGEVGTGDINAMVNDYLIADLATEVNQTYNLPANYSPSKKTGWISYFPGDSRCIKYPCIEGKLYVDELTGNIYRYTNNKMILVNPEVSECTVITSGGDIDETDLTNGSYYIKSTPLICLYAKMESGLNKPNTIFNSNETITYTIGDVTSILNVMVAYAANRLLLTGDVNEFIKAVDDFEGLSDLLNDIEGEDAQQLKDYVDSILDLKNYATTLEQLLSLISELNLPNLFHKSNITSGALKYYIFAHLGSVSPSDEYILEPFHIAGPTGAQILLSFADMNGDGVLTLDDALWIQTAILSNTNTGPVRNFTKTIQVLSAYLHVDNNCNVLLRNLIGRRFFDPETNTSWVICSDDGTVILSENFKLAVSGNTTDPKLDLIKDSAIISRVSLKFIFDRIKNLENFVGIPNPNDIDPNNSLASRLAAVEAQLEQEPLGE